MRIRRITSRVLVGAVLTILSVSHLASAQASNDLPTKLKRAVVAINTFDEQGNPLLQATGFFLSPERIVTNFSVVNSVVAIRVRTFGGQMLTGTQVIAADQRSDLALLKIHPPAFGVAPLSIEESEPAEGEPILLVNNLLNSQWKSTTGEIGTTWDFYELGERRQFTAELAPGSNGGPVLNLRGQVIGIIAGPSATHDGLNFAIPIARLKELLAATK